MIIYSHQSSVSMAIMFHMAMNTRASELQIDALIRRQLLYLSPQSHWPAANLAHPQEAHPSRQAEEVAQAREASLPWEAAAARQAQEGGLRQTAAAAARPAPGRCRCRSGSRP